MTEPRPACDYRVLIPYREPGFERRLKKPRTSPFFSECRVRARSPEEAVEEAVRRFRDRARASSVFWVREIQVEGIRVERVEG